MTDALTSALATGLGLGAAIQQVTGYDTRPRNKLMPGPGFPTSQAIPSPPPSNMLVVGSKLWSNNRQAYATMLPSGVLAVFDARGEGPTNPARILWTSNQGSTIIDPIVPPFNPNNRPAAVMQNDGNLVITDFGPERNGYPPWSTANTKIRRGWNETQGYDLSPGAYLIMQDDGNLVIYQEDGKKALWGTGTYGFMPSHPPQDNAATVAATVVEVIATVLTVIFPAVGIAVDAALSAVLGAVIHTLPGLLRGEPVDQVFMQNLSAVATKVTGYAKEQLGEAAQQLSPDLGRVSQQLTEWGNSASNQIDFSRLADLPEDIRKQVAATIDIQTLANQLGVRPDIVQVMVDGATRTAGVSGHIYDATGQIAPPIRISKVSAAALRQAVTPKQQIKLTGGAALRKALAQAVTNNDQAAVKATAKQIQKTNSAMPVALGATALLGGLYIILRRK